MYPTVKKLLKGYLGLWRSKWLSQEGILVTSHNGAIRVTVDQDGAIVSKLSGNQPIATVVMTAQQAQEATGFLSEGLQAAGVTYTTDIEHTIVEARPTEERSGYHTYTVYSQYDKKAINVTVQGLLQIADFVAKKDSR